MAVGGLFSETALLSGAFGAGQLVNVGFPNINKGLYPCNSILALGVTSAIAETVYRSMAEQVKTGKMGIGQVAGGPNYALSSGLFHAFVYDVIKKGIEKDNLPAGPAEEISNGAVAGALTAGIGATMRSFHDVASVYAQALRGLPECPKSSSVATWKWMASRLPQELIQPEAIRLIAKQVSFRGYSAIFPGMLAGALVAGLGVFIRQEMMNPGGAEFDTKR